MKRLNLMIILLVSFFCANAIFAQKKEISLAKDQVKSGNNLAQAQANMQKLLKDSANQRNLKIWNLLYEAVRKQYEQGNEKLYLKQSYDTAQLFNLARQLFEVAERMDSVEMLPDSKGRVRIVFRKNHAEYLGQIRPNLYSGGLWLIRKQKYLEAYEMLNQYLHCANIPLFANYDYCHKDKNISTAAYWAVFCGYKMQNPQATLHHSYEALKDTVHYDYMLQYLAETYKLEKDSVRYLAILKDGFRHAPKFPFFFPRLIEYYVGINQLDSAMRVTDKALEADSLNQTYLFTKSTLLLNKGKNAESLAISEKLLAIKDSLPEVYYNAGLANFNMAVLLDKDVQFSRSHHRDINQYYRKAMPYLETYRKLMPKDVEKWALPLYTIYLNLNMGKEFDEIDKLVKKKEYQQEPID